MKLALTLLLLTLSSGWAAKNSKTHNPMPGVVASGEVEYGVMMTIKGKTSISRFTDKDRNITCYVSHKHKTDEVIAMSCVPSGKK
jgi:catabolite regulation protein CreA